MSTKTNGVSTFAVGDNGGAAAEGDERSERVMVALQAMLRQERIFYERKCKEYVQNPNVRIKDLLAESEQRIADLERQFSECTRKLEAAQQRQRTNSSPSPKNASGDGTVGAASPVVSLSSSFNFSTGSNATLSNHNDLSMPSKNGAHGANGKSPRSNDRHEPLEVRESSASLPPSTMRPRSSSEVPSVPLATSASFHGTGSRKPSKPLQHAALALQTIIIDDEDYDDMVAADNLSGAFSSLDNLNTDHARMAVFIRYLMDDNSNGSDPDPLFFYLLTGIYSRQRGTSVKEIRRFARAIEGLFFAENAPMHVSVRAAIMERVEAVVENKASSNDTLLAVFHDARFHLATHVISQQLARFREKRTLGFGTLFGDVEALENITNKDEKVEAIRKLLCPLLTNLAGMDPAFSKVDQNVTVRNAALSMALLTFLEDSGVIIDNLAKLTGKAKKKSGLSMLVRRKTTNVKIIDGHHFYPTHYNSPVYCDFCDGLLWGLGYQGLTCQTCGFNVHHKTACSQSLKDMPCHSDAPERSRSSISGKKHSVSSSSTSLYVPAGGTSPSSSTTLATSPGNAAASQLAANSSSSFAESTPSLNAVSSEDMSSPGRDADHVEAGSSAEQVAGLRMRRRLGPVSRSSGHADSERVQKRLSTSNVMRARSLNYPKKPTKYDTIGSRHDSSGTLSVEEPPMRSPSLNDIPLDSGDGHSSSSPDQGQQGPFSPKSDPEMDYEEELVPWVEIVQNKDPAFITKLSQKDVKRQGFIHELIHTEATHLKKLKLMQNCFYLPLLRAELVSEEQLDKLFPNLNMLIAHHRFILRLMRDKMDPDRFGYVTAIADVFRQTMGPENGKEYQSACSDWVSKNQENLDYIRREQNSSQRFATFMKTCESAEVLHRSRLAELTSCMMQRLTKYPLLLEGIQKSTICAVDKEEHSALTEALTLCRGTLSFVNASVHVYDNTKYLQEISSKLDTRDLENCKDFVMASYYNIDLSLKKLVHHSDLLWRAHRDVIPVHALLLQDLIILLEYNESRTQYYLRVHGDFGSVIRVNDLHVRSVAVDKKAFYLVDLKGEPPKMYSLKAHTNADCLRWLTATTEVTKARKVFAPPPTVAGLSPALRPRSNHDTTPGGSPAMRRPLPEQPPPRPPQVISHAPRTPPDEPCPATLSEEEDEDAGSEREEAAFEEELCNANHRISGSLRSRQHGPASVGLAAPQVSQERRPSTMEPVLDACMQQARIVSSLAKELLQPHQPDPTTSPVEPHVRPANYHLVEASQQLSLQLASMQTLFMHRELAIASIQKELDDLRQRSGDLDQAASARIASSGSRSKDVTDGPEGTGEDSVDCGEAECDAAGGKDSDDGDDSGDSDHPVEMSIDLVPPVLSSTLVRFNKDTIDDSEDYDEEEEMC